MAQLLKPQNVKIVTRDGELVVSIQLDININLNQTGSIDVNNVVANAVSPNTVKKQEEDKIPWEIPDFGGTEKIKFGK